jgi:uncharacterized membrane protein
MMQGVFLGLCAAFFQSGSYLFTKRYVAAFEKSTLGLLVAGHCIMGIFSVALLPFFFPPHLPPVSHIAFPLVFGVASYLAAQAAFFLSLKSADASRVSPLLGLKILILAAISITILSRHFGLLQWGGIAVSLVAAYLLGSSGSPLTLRSWGFIAAVCLFYSLSDLCIRQLIVQFTYLGLFDAAVVSTCLCYILAGAAAACCLPFAKVRSVRRWRLAFPFAVFWFAGILFLFGCFGSIGVVFGNIVQSTRGVLSLGMGWVVAFLGHEHIEEKISGRVFAYRVIAGLLMVGAIALFYLG